MTINLRIKKRLASFAFVLAISFLGFSQDDGARVVTASQAISGNGQFYIQVGIPYLGITSTGYYYECKWSN